MRRHKYKRIEPSTKEKIALMFKDGFTPLDIHKETGISEGYISEILTKELEERKFFGHYSTKGTINLNKEPKTAYYETEEEIEKSLSLKYKPEELTGEERFMYYGKI